MKKNYICPVCGYDKIENPIYDNDGYGTYEICPCCGFEFGCDDYPKKEEAFINWRNIWIINGCQWFSQSTKKPKIWDPKKQLANLKQNMKNKGGSGMRPLIGVLCKPNMFSPQPWNTYQVSSDVAGRLIERGGDVIGIVPLCPQSVLISDDLNTSRTLSMEEQLSIKRKVFMCDGIVAQGGLTSDSWEVFAIQCAMKEGIPIFGICAGFNNIVRAFGGQTYEMSESEQKVHNIESSDNAHFVNINADGLFHRLFNQLIISVNSIHSMALLVQEIPKALQCEATYCDSEGKITIEALSNSTIIATKWHPEFGDQTYSSILWDLFMQRCVAYKNQK